MPAVDTSCYALPPEKESGAGEMSCYKHVSSGSSSLAHAVASEIVNDIFDNAYEVILAKNMQQTPKLEKITSNVVGDIIDNILSPSLNNNTSNQSLQHDETALLDEEIKRIIKEMKFPPEQNNVICTKGVGDQLGDKSEVMPDKVLTEPPKRLTLERKSRLTNLVRNSKQMLAKLVISDNGNELQTNKSDYDEEILKVIDLEIDENVERNDEPSSSGITESKHSSISPDAGMDIVNLDSNMLIEEMSTAVNGADKDEKEISSCSDEKLENKVENKKKWNLGAKILRYLKRRSKKE